MCTPAALAQAAFSLQASTASGAPFPPATLQGKVAIVFYWSTTCPVCMDSLPELRANLAGWKQKPFALVTVNMDANINEWLGYERIASQLRSPSGLVSVRPTVVGALPGKLPVTLLLDAKGKVVSRYEGRMAPEAWDGVAELLLQ
jgi:thiol-disulfide isomerase/thioredoxin